jgi:hypothetical protein
MLKSHGKFGTWVAYLAAPRSSAGTLSAVFMKRPST